MCQLIGVGGGGSNSIVLAVVMESISYQSESQSVAVVCSNGRHVSSRVV